MSINIGPPESDELRPRISVIGIGGAGGNAISNMMAAGIQGVDFIVANTDSQALGSSGAETRIQLGPEITGGLGAGARPEVGKAAAEETVEEIENALDGVNMCFIAAGMGGGTGTGAAPVIAEAARRKNVLTVGVVTKPFLFEGTRRMRAAEAGIEELQKHVDTLIVIPNQNLFLIAKAETTFKEAFLLADEVLQQGVRSITDLMVMPGLINLDFADVKSVMEEMGKAMMGTGEGEGENRALEAAERAIANPLLDGVSMQGAKGVIISIIGGDDMKLLEIDEAANHIRELVDDDANIIWGSALNPDFEGKIRVSVVATGIVPGEGALDSSGSSGARTLGESHTPRRPVLDIPEEGESFSGQDIPAPMSSDMELEDDEFDEFDDDNPDDVGGISDPLAGLRRAESQAEPEPILPHNDDPADANIAFGRDIGNDDEGGWSDVPDSADEEAPLDLTTELPASDGKRGDDSWDKSSDEDELLLDADRLVDEDKPIPAQTGDDRRRGLVSGASDKAPSGGGSTLFERMANLSRGTDEPDDDEEETEINSDSGALNIPRFLGRQNNQ